MNSRVEPAQAQSIHTCAIKDLLVVIGVYAAWGLLVWYGEQIPILLLFIAGGYVTCLHGSLQHIAVHGSPTRHRWLNTLIATPPLALYYPYPVYRESHLEHHYCEELTDFEVDPESLYVSREHWSKLNELSRFIYRFQFTLLGRLLIGPFVSYYQLLKSEALRIYSGEKKQIGIWLLHILACMGVLYFVSFVGNMPIWKYLLCFAYPGISFTLLRSYTEHRWSPLDDERSIIVEGSPVTKLLYLNNNFHWIHHEHPGMHWSLVAKVFHEQKVEILRKNGNFYYKNYSQILRRLWKDRLIDPIHPTELA